MRLTLSLLSVLLLSPVAVAQVGPPPTPNPDPYVWAYLPGVGWGWATEEAIRVSRASPANPGPRPATPSYTPSYTPQTSPCPNGRCPNQSSSPTLIPQRRF